MKWQIAIAVLCLVAGLGVAEDKADERGPVALSMGLSGGATYSWFDSDGDMQYYLEPTSRVEKLKTARGGIDFVVNIGRWFGIGTGVYFEEVGQRTPMSEVALAQDPYLHTFRSNAVVRYFAVPLVARFGYVSDRYWGTALAGITGAQVYDETTEWYFDGQRSVYTAPSTSAVYDVRLCGGFEAGVRFGHSGIVSGINYEHGLRSVIEGVDGGARLRSVNGKFGYRWFF